MSTPSERYCSTCGSELVTETVGAETIKEYGWDGDEYTPYTAYDSKTGLRNWATRYYCPNKSRFNSHTDFKRRAYLLN